MAFASTWLRAGPRAARGANGCRLFRYHPAGPGALPSQAHRGTLGPGRGRLSGREFPAGLWSEWNGKYRDTCADYWRGADQSLGEFASRLSPAAPIFTAPAAVASLTRASISSPATTVSPCATWSRTGRSTIWAMANTIATETAPTVPGTVAPRRPASDPIVNLTRARQTRKFLASLFLSQGVPMLLGGDEIGRTQAGNNNAYCQDNENRRGSIGTTRTRSCWNLPVRSSDSTSATRSSGAADGSRACQSMVREFGISAGSSPTVRRCRRRIGE